MEMKHQFYQENVIFVNQILIIQKIVQLFIFNQIEKKSLNKLLLVFNNREFSLVEKKKER